METMRFRGEYSFLSNFQYFDTPMKYNDPKGLLLIQSNESFYQAMKFVVGSDLRRDVATRSLKGLKKYVNEHKSEWREDWDDIKLDVMLFGLRYKFSINNPTLRQKLIDTGRLDLVEGNWHNDSYWGFCLKTEQGENHLGRLLMKVRGEINI